MNGVKYISLNRRKKTLKAKAGEIITNLQDTC